MKGSFDQKTCNKFPQQCPEKKGSRAIFLRTSSFQAAKFLKKEIRLNGLSVLQSHTIDPCLSLFSWRLNIVMTSFKKPFHIHSLVINNSIVLISD